MLQKSVVFLFFISLIMLGVSISLTVVINPLFAIGIGLWFIGILYTMIICFCCSGGFITISPNEAVVYQYYGRYLGTVKDNGYFNGYPMSKIFRLSLRSNQYNGNKLKVNERDVKSCRIRNCKTMENWRYCKSYFWCWKLSIIYTRPSWTAIRYIRCKYP